jgi:hypothetical protein
MHALTLGAGLLCVLTLANAQQQPTYESIYKFAHSRGDLSIYALGMDMFPDIALRFADPSPPSSPPTRCVPKHGTTPCMH